MTILFGNHLGIGQTAASRRALKGLPEVPGDGDDAIWPWDLHLQVRPLCIEHELGECWQTQESMVRVAEVGDLEPDRLPPKVLLCAKDEIQPNAPHRGA